MSKRNIYIINADESIEYQKELLNLNKNNNIFNFISHFNKMDGIKLSSRDEEIIEAIEEMGMNKVDVSLILVGKKPLGKKDYLCDWEFAATFNNKIENKKSAIIILLPGADGFERIYSEETEKNVLHKWSYKEPAEIRWNKVSFIYPSMPSRIIDNLIDPKVKIDIIKYEKIMENPKKLKALIQTAIQYSKENVYVDPRPLMQNRMMK